MKNKTLIYIIGAGRSGTTLLDILMGNNKDSISLGEINRFFKRNGLPPKRKFGTSVYVFWEKIVKAFKSEIKTPNFKNFDQVFKRNEYHSTIIKSLIKKNDKVYVYALKKKYDLLYENLNESLLIESSKYPVRGLNLSNYISNKKFDVKFIYLKKNPVKVVKSFQKKDLEQPSKNFVAANIYYLSVNLLCIITVFVLKSRKHKVSIISYEDLIGNSQKTVEKLSNELQVDFIELQEKLLLKKPLKTGFLFDGNRIRLKETLTLRTSEENEKKDFKYYFTRGFNYIVYR